MSVDPSVRIVIAAHKPAPFPEDPLYLPVQVNAAVNPPIEGFQSDDEGDSISALNYRYCELTALWWAWKNLEADYMGMVQYRRLFCSPSKNKGSRIEDSMNLAEAKTLCAEHNLILPKARNYYIQSLENHFRGYSFYCNGDFEAFRKAVANTGFDYASSFDRVMARKTGHMCNMFIMRRDYLDDYCSWLFTVMNDLDKTIDGGRTRILGYFAEHMLDIWADANGVDYHEVGCVFLDNENELRKRMGYALRLLGLKDVSEKVVRRQK